MLAAGWLPTLVAIALNDDDDDDATTSTFSANKNNFNERDSDDDALMLRTVALDLLERVPTQLVRFDFTVFFVVLIIVCSFIVIVVSQKIIYAVEWKFT